MQRHFIFESSSDQFMRWHVIIVYTSDYVYHRLLPSIRLSIHATIHAATEMEIHGYSFKYRRFKMIPWVPESSSQNDYFPWDEYIFVKVFRTFQGICCAKVLLWIRTAYRYLSRYMSHRRLWINTLMSLTYGCWKPGKSLQGAIAGFVKTIRCLFHTHNKCALYLFPLFSIAPFDR